MRPGPSSVLAALLLSAGWAAADFQSGLSAYESGDFEKALAEWLPLAGRGEIEAQYYLARVYASGPGLQDDVQAARWYREAARQGHAKAQNNLGLMLEQGRGGKQDDQEAATWYRRAADQGLLAAQYNLGLLYEAGKGVESDPDEAARRYAGAAERGHSPSQYRLGSLYERGVGVPQNDARAAKWYRRAAGHGHAEAQLALGTLYDAGRGVERSSIRAAKWYRAAAAQGLSTPLTSPAGRAVAPETPPPAEPLAVATEIERTEPSTAGTEDEVAGPREAEAQYRLGQQLATEQNTEQAARWYLAAAEQGHAMAAYKLAFLYLRGEGRVPRDSVQAYVWFSRAAERDLGDAAEWRDDVAKRMSRHELDEARRVLAGP